MSGVSIRISVEGDAHARLKTLIGKIENNSDFFAAASDQMQSQTMDRFREQRDPDGAAWTPLSPVTVAARGGRATPILEETGSFRMQISPQPESDRAVVTTGPFAQAAILQNGGEAGRGLTVTIPARPYFGFGSDDVEELIELAEGMIFDPG